MALCLLILALGVVSSGLSTLWAMGPWAAAVAVTIWAVYWRPRIVVEDDGVLLVNVVRTIRVPWQAIRSIETRWTLTLVTDAGRFAAWASPGPGGMAQARAVQRADRDVRFGSAGPMGGWTATTSARVSAADMIRGRWEKLRPAEPARPAPTPTIHRHWPVIVVVPALVAVGIIAAVA
jgi:hypothetical protein